MAIPNVAALGAGRAFLRRARDMVERLGRRAMGTEPDEVALLLRDFDAILLAADKRAADAAERAPTTLGKSKRGRRSPYRYRVLRTTEGGHGGQPAQFADYATIGEAAYLLKVKESTLRSAMSKGDGRYNVWRAMAPAEPAPGKLARAKAATGVPVLYTVERYTAEQNV